MNLDANLVVEAVLLQLRQDEYCPCTSARNVTFVIRVSKRHADAFASRPDILSRAGLLVKFGRDSHPDWQQRQMAVMGSAPRGIESIVLQGPIEQLKEVRHTHPTFSDFYYHFNTCGRLAECVFSLYLGANRLSARRMATTSNEVKNGASPYTSTRC